MIGIGKAVQTAALAKELSPKLSELKRATDGFETIFVKNLLSQMRKGIKEVSFGENPGGDIYQDMADQAFAESLSSTGMLGMGKMLYGSFAPKLLAEERQRMISDALRGESTLAAEKRWMLGIQSGKGIPNKEQKP